MPKTEEQKNFRKIREALLNSDAEKLEDPGSLAAQLGYFACVLCSLSKITPTKALKMYQHIVDRHREDMSASVLEDHTNFKSASNYCSLKLEILDR